MTESVVTRLHTAIERTQANPQLTDAIVIEYLDAIELRDLIAALCRGHGACEDCQTVLCDDCGLGQRAIEDHGRILCAECEPHCVTCNRDSTWPAGRAL